MNLGGDLRVSGESPTGDGWTIAVEHPSAERSIAMVGLGNGGVATSTTLLRRWTVDGEVRHHLIDPATGEPTTSDLSLASVVAACAWQAEVLAKSVLLRGATHPFDVIDGEGAEALAITAGGEAALGKKPRPDWMLDLHRFLGGAGVAFVGVHVAAIMLDSYTHFGPVDVLVPLASSWRPVAVAWGIVSAYLLLAVEITSLMRKKLSKRAPAPWPSGSPPSPSARSSSPSPASASPRAAGLPTELAPGRSRQRPVALAGRFGPIPAARRSRPGSPSTGTGSWSAPLRWAAHRAPATDRAASAGQWRQRAMGASPPLSLQ